MPHKHIATRRAYQRQYQAKRRAEERKARDAAANAGLNLPEIPKSPSAQVEAIARWSRDTLKIPAGHPQAGRPLILQDFQLRFLEGALSHRESAMILGRKNGKSQLCAIWALAYLTEGSPLLSAGFRIGVVSLTLKHSKELIDLAKKLIVSSRLDGLSCRLTPFPGRVNNERLDSVLESLSADRSGTGHSVGFDLLLIDEAGLMPEKSRELITACRSSVSAKNGRFAAISIRGDSPILEEMILRGDSPTTYIQLHECRSGSALDDEAAWKLSNPGLECGIKAWEYMRDLSQMAIKTPADERSFRIQEMNERGSPVQDVIVSVTDWQACETDDPPARTDRCFVGVDLGGSQSMASAVILWDNGRLECYGAFPREPDLLVRGRKDRCGELYLRMQKEGSLSLVGSRTVDVSAFLGSVLDDVGIKHIAAIGTDRFRKNEFLQVLDELRLNVPVFWRGTGSSATADGSYDCRSFQRMVAEKRIQTKPTLLMQAALRYAELKYDSGGNPSLNKIKQHSRIDCLQAGVIATGLYSLQAGRVNRNVGFWT